MRSSREPVLSAGSPILQEYVIAIYSQSKLIVCGFRIRHDDVPWKQVTGIAAILGDLLTDLRGHSRQSRSLSWQISRTDDPALKDVRSPGVVLTF